MILQSLHDYYQRKVAEDPKAMAPPGFQPVEIGFVIVLDAGGRFVDLDDNRDRVGKKLRGTPEVVPQAAKRSGMNSWQIANLLWDHPGYVLGVGEDAKAEQAQRQHQSFIALLRETFPEPDFDPGVAAVLRFLEAGEFIPVLQHGHWPEVLKSKANLSFRLQGDEDLVCQRPAVRRAIAATGDEADSVRGQCLITGEQDAIQRLHPVIKGVWGAQSSGANIVSFNLQAFNSFGRDQGFNAPMGQQGVFGYTSALNHLLRPGSRQRLQVGDASTVFWAGREHVFEDDFLDFLEINHDDPDRNTEAVRSLYGSPWRGKAITADDATPFFVLGLAPNAARISVRFWHPATVGEIAGSIARHFEDLCLEQASGEVPFLGVSRLLESIALQGKRENIPPNLAGELMRAILTDTPYPWTLLTGAIRRIRAERRITHPRAALIKAVLVRRNRHQQEVGVSLDTENPNIGYRLGRLFAALERAQETANPGLNATIRDRYYGAASATPVTVFPQLLKLKVHHLAKLENRGQAVNLERLIGEIIDGIDGFPGHLTMEDQGRFAIGYYHQRQQFYKKAEKSEAPHQSEQGESA